MKLALAMGALLMAAPAFAATDDVDGGRTPGRVTRPSASQGIPSQLTAEERSAYRSVFEAIRSQRWADAQLQLAALKPGPLHAIARAQIYTAPSSPKTPLEPLLALLAEAPELPQAQQLARLAQLRGATSLPSLPTEQRMTWFDGAPTRIRTRAIRSDQVAAELAVAMKPFVKLDDGPSAEALLNQRAGELTPEALTEWQQRVAWIYFVAGDDGNARRVARLAQTGRGDWAAQADWTQGLAAWRQKDCAAAQVAFGDVARRASDTELRSAGLYWATRADIACGRPDLVQPRLQSAAQYGDTYYGLLARQALGMIDRKSSPEKVTADWQMLERRPNVRVAAALSEIGEAALADQVLRHQAKIGDPSDYAALTRVSGSMNLPATQLWLSHNGPAGAKPVMEARFPEPNWTPDGGWRVDKSLVYAHALQESKFNPQVVSPAGAFGLMQIMPAAASDFGRARGVTIDRSALARPSTNIEVGQSYLEKLRDMSATGGLLPKVIAAYNAGPSPVQAWDLQSRDGGDPLLYIESIPYWETRGYVMSVLRNYWMYEKQAGKTSASRAALAQGMWPKFPGAKGSGAVRISSAGRSRLTNAN